MSGALPCRPKRSGRASGARRGAVVVLFLVVLVVVMAVGALALNLAWLTTHQVQLRQACEAAALAGAVELFDPAPWTDTDSLPAPATVARMHRAVRRAQRFFDSNTSAVLRTTGNDPDVVAGWIDDPTSPTSVLIPRPGGGPVNGLLVRGVHRRGDGQAVLLWFGSLFGARDAEPAAAAIAAMDQRIYGFRPTALVNVPMVPLLSLSDTRRSRWPSSVPGAEPELPDNYSVALRTGAVSAGADGVAEITLRVPVSAEVLPLPRQNASWLSLSGGATDFSVLLHQVSKGLAVDDVAAMGGEFALGQGGTVPVSLAPPTTVEQAAALQQALLAIRGRKRIWPLGNLVTEGSEPSCQVTGFAAGCVVDCRVEEGALAVVVQACALQTCTGLLRRETARNPWIGKLILHEWLP